MKKMIFVTGGAGFIGSNLCEKLVDLGHQVVCYDNLSTGNYENIRHLLANKNFKLVVADIRDVESLSSAMEGCTHVSHQAALGSVPRSISNPSATNENNIAGSLNVLHTAMQIGIKRFVYASSSSVYGNSSVSPKKEGEEGEVMSPYAVTKQTLEKYAKVYKEIHGMETIGLRYFNVFGPKQSPSGAYAAVIPIFINKALLGEPIPINGTGEQTRDFTYIENVVDANVKSLFSAKPESFGKNFNIACAEYCSVVELANKIKNTISAVSPKHHCKLELMHNPERVGDVRDSLADLGLSTQLLGYMPLVLMDAGLESTIRWFLKVLDEG